MDSRPAPGKKGLLITFEGIEGSGKTTQIRLFSKYLESLGYPVLLTREPGGTPVADRIRQTLLDPKSRLTPEWELLLYQVARKDHILEKVQPALKKGQVVLCDRFTDATLAYQGYGRGLSLPLVEHFNRMATGGLKPDLTLLLDLPVGLGLARSRQRLEQTQTPEGRFEAESLAFHERVRQGYLTLARKEPNRFCVIDAQGTEEEVFTRIQEAWQKWAGNKSRP